MKPEISAPVINWVDPEMVSGKEDLNLYGIVYTND